MAFVFLIPEIAYAQNTVPLMARADQMQNLFFGLLIGVVLSAAMYLFFIWAVMRDRGQVFLILFLLFLCLRIYASNDLLMAQIGVHAVSEREFLQQLSLVASWLFALYFTYYFLELDINAPSFRAPFVMIGGLLVLVLIFSLFNRSILFFGMPIIGASVLAAILLGGLSGVRQGTSGSMVHLIAFVCFLIGILAEPAYMLGYISFEADKDNVVYVSFALSSLMFAIVIASQFAARQDEKEKALALSNERFSLATRGANEGLFDWNLRTGEVFFSDQFRKILGFRLLNSAEGLKKWVRMMEQPYRRVVTQTVRRFRRNATAVTLTIEYCIVRSNGERRWLHSKAVAVRDKATNKVVRFVGSTSDITERKKGEFALLASEGRLRNIIEAHPVPVLIISLTTGAVLYATPGSEKLLGASREDLERDFLENFMPDYEFRRQLLDEIIAGNPVDNQETRIIRGDKTEIPAAISARSISFQDESAMVMGIYDLTERKQAEAQIAQQQEALQQSEKMAALGGLLAGVAHELNNPLSVVVGQSTLLMEGAPEPKVATRAEKIFKAADRCSRIVKSFLAIARRKPPERKTVDLNHIVKSSLELLGYQLRTGDVEIQSNLDSDLGEIIGDNDQLTQVVTNLVLNAAQALENWKGTRRITVSTRRVPGGFLFLTIEDTGPGVPQEIRTRIFEPFYTTKSSRGGTGVGLSLCLNIISAHGGEIIVSETKGGGATFSIRLPAKQEKAEDGGSGLGDTPDKMAAMTILLVDDEVELAQTLADLMEPDGHTIDIAANGAIALEKLKKTKFDVIISDLRMPVMDGPALYQALERELPSYLNRIIYVTGDTLSSHVQEFLANHTLVVVEKPYRIRDIRRALSELFKDTTLSENG